MTSVEITLIAAAIGGIAVPIAQSMFENSNKILVFLGKTLDDKTKEIIFKASRKYAQNYKKRHGIIKVLGMPEPIPLEDVYTAVRFLTDRDLRSMDSVQDLEAEFRTQRSQKRRKKLTFNKHKNRPGLEVANDKQFLMVLGGPGAGKSTFLRKIGLEALQGKLGGFKHECIPVFIELKQFSLGEIDIKDTISKEFSICGFPKSEKFTSEALRQGKLLIFFDGLDEVATEQLDTVIQKIHDFVDQYDQNRFIASCRRAAYRRNFRRFTDVAMAPFDDDQIKTFIENWFRHNPEIGEDCWQKLNHSENVAAKELTQTPLLLTLICLLYQRARKFPAKRATLYEKALRVLLEEWAGEKGIPQEELYKGLDTRLKETMLSEIAYNAFIQDHLFLSRRDISKQIQDFLEESIPEESSIDGASVLRNVEVQHGILVERAVGIYSFSHLTLQEYLTAQYIDDNRKISELVKQYFLDPRWQEVFLLVSGIMRGGADILLLEMQFQSRRNFKEHASPKLNELLRWASKSIASSNENGAPLISNRVIAIALSRVISNSMQESIGDSGYSISGIYVQILRLIKYRQDKGVKNSARSLYGSREASETIKKFIKSDESKSSDNFVVRDNIRDVCRNIAGDKTGSVCKAAYASNVHKLKKRIAVLHEILKNSKSKIDTSSRRSDRAVYRIIENASKKVIEEVLRNAVGKLWKVFKK